MKTIDTGQITFFKKKSKKMFLPVALLLFGAAPLYAQYCTPASGNYGCGDGDEVNSFSLVGENSTSISDLNSGCSTSAYDDQTALAAVDLLPGASYTANVSSEYYGDYCAIWIDLNNDQVFQSSERVATYNQYVNSPGTSAITLDIPANATAGQRRMRVVVAYPYDQNFNSITAADFDPCNTGSHVWDYGETHDYTVNILPPPACAAPSALTASSVTSNSATINWTASVSSPGNGYEYYYSSSSAAPTTATTPSGSTTGTSAALSGLSANTQYYVWARSACSSTLSSGWSAPVTFTTLCGAVSTFPWTENFDALSNLGYNDFPGCWYKENGDWETTNENIFNVAYSGNNYLEDDYVAYNDYIWAPAFQLTAGTIYTFSFYMQGDGYGTPHWDVSVYWNTTQSSSGATQIGTNFAPPGSGNLTFGGSPYEKKTFYFSPTVSGVYYFGINVTSDYYPYYLAFDDFEFAIAPPCNAPDTLSATNITTSSADLNWNGDTTKTYILEYGPSGFTPGTGTVVSIVDSLNYTATGLNPNTDYDYYVKKVCAPGVDTSDYSITETFTTLCNTPIVSLGSDSGICEGTFVVLDAGNPGATYKWNNNSTNQTLTTTLGGEYYVTVTNIYGCSASDTVTLTSYPNPVVNLGPDGDVCQGTTVVLDAGNAGDAFLWNTSETTQSINVVTGGNYFVTVTDAHLCTGSDTVVITANQPPVVLGLTAELNPDGSYHYSPAGTQHVEHYFWDFGDGDTSNEEFPDHSYTQTGNYQITLAVSNSCGTDTVRTLLHHEATGINELSLQKQVKLYPNPAKDLLTIQNESSYKMSEITVYNVLGQIIFHTVPDNKKQYQIHLSNYASGIYTLKVKLNETNVVSRFEVMK
jgi:hypothetical protein